MVVQPVGWVGVLVGWLGGVVGVRVAVGWPGGVVGVRVGVTPGGVVEVRVGVTPGGGVAVRVGVLAGVPGVLVGPTTQLPGALFQSFDNMLILVESVPLQVPQAPVFD